MFKDFLWNYFSSTGDIESYLLYKDHQRTIMGENALTEQASGEESMEEY